MNKIKTLFIALIASTCVLAGCSGSIASTISAKQEPTVEPFEPQYPKAELDGNALTVDLVYDALERFKKDIVVTYDGPVTYIDEEYTCDRYVKYNFDILYSILDEFDLLTPEEQEAVKRYLADNYAYSIAFITSNMMSSVAVNSAVKYVIDSIKDFFPIESVAYKQTYVDDNVTNEDELLALSVFVNTAITTLDWLKANFEVYRKCESELKHRILLAKFGQNLFDDMNNLDPKPYEQLDSYLSKRFDNYNIFKTLMNVFNRAVKGNDFFETLIEFYEGFDAFIKIINGKLPIFVNENQVGRANLYSEETPIEIIKGNDLLIEIFLKAIRRLKSLYPGENLKDIPSDELFLMYIYCLSEEYDHLGYDDQQEVISYLNDNGIAFISASISPLTNVSFFKASITDGLEDLKSYFNEYVGNKFSSILDFLKDLIGRLFIELVNHYDNFDELKDAVSKVIEREIATYYNDILSIELKDLLALAIDGLLNIIA